MDSDGQMANSEIFPSLMVLLNLENVYFLPVSTRTHGMPSTVHRQTNSSAGNIKIMIKLSVEFAGIGNNITLALDSE